MRRSVALPLLLAFAAPASAQVKTFTSDADFDAGQLVQTAHPPAHQLQLGPTPVTKTTNVWACHTEASMVVRIDTKTGRQTGRYDAALQFINGQPTGADAPLTATNYPRRVAVDNNGDVWISNGAFSGTRQGTLSKFSGYLEHCIDRNHNGVIDTSKDANGDGLINTFDPQEYFGQNDECILTTIKIGPVGATPRGVAVDRNGKIWVCENQCVGGQCRIYRFNPNEPVALEATVSVQGNPYSLASGGQYIYAGNSGGGIATRINIETLQVEYVNGCPGYYGALVAHPTKDVSYIGTGGNSIVRADFAAKRCTSIGTGPVYTVSMDRDFNVWGAHISTASVSKVSPNDVLLGTYPVGGSAHGVSVDFDGFVWLNGYNLQSCMKINPANGQQLSAPSYACPGCPNPKGVNYTSYLYSDFTGYQVNRQAPYTYFGTWTSTPVDGGTNDIPWAKVTYNTEAQGATPCDQPNNRCTGLKVYVRAHNDPMQLPTVGFVQVQSGQPLPKVAGRYAQVEVQMTGPGYLTPVLSDVSVFGPCGQGVGENCCLKDTDCNDGNPCTTDVCPAPAGKCTHTARPACCARDSDCDDRNQCTTDRCPMAGGMCQNTNVKGCCNVDADCNDGNLCSEDRCANNKCSNPPIAGCCNANADCDDQNVCTIDLCSGAGGTCGHFARNNCCNVDGDCDDQNVCTVDKCSGVGGTCTNTRKPACCNVDLDCDDKEDCTIDKCSGKGGTCSYAKRANCCKSFTDCDDKDPCTTDTCQKGACTFTPILRCCNMNGQCDDGDVCTVDTCSGPGGACQRTRTADCCSQNTDCDDRDPCTVDRCSGPGGKCSHDSPGQGCCRKHADCDDGRVCTTDRCGGDVCLHDPLANCFCNSANDCPEGWLCVDRACQPQGSGGDGGPSKDTYASANGVWAGCSVAPPAASHPWSWALLLLPLALLGLRRRQRR